MFFDIEFPRNQNCSPFDVEFHKNKAEFDIDIGISNVPITGDKAYVHSQNTASKEWHVVHGLGKHPSVSVVDSADNIVVGEVTYLDENSLIIYFSAPFSGRAYLN